MSYATSQPAFRIYSSSKSRWSDFHEALDGLLTECVTKGTGGAYLIPRTLSNRPTVPTIAILLIISQSEPWPQTINPRPLRLCRRFPIRLSDELLHDQPFRHRPLHLGTECLRLTYPHIRRLRYERYSPRLSPCCGSHSTSGLFLPRMLYRCARAYSIRFQQYARK